MSWNTGIPQTYHTSEAATPNTGLLATRQFDLETICRDNCPTNQPGNSLKDDGTPNARERRGYFGSSKTGYLWVCFSNEITDDADPGSGALADPTANRYMELMPQFLPFEPNGKRYMSVFDPDANTVVVIEHKY
jgi:hypothetical protein